MKRAGKKHSIIILVTLFVFIVSTISQNCFALEMSQPIDIEYAKEVMENRLTEMGYESNEIQQRLACLSDDEIISLAINENQIALGGGGKRGGKNKGSATGAIGHSKEVQSKTAIILITVFIVGAVFVPLIIF